MQINELYQAAIAGDKSAEKQLFELLDERFQRFVRHRIWDKDGVEDIVQDVLLTIAREFRQIRIETSFAAWAYKVLDFRILNHLKSRSRRQMVSTESLDQELPHPPGEDPILKHTLMKCLQKLHAANSRYARIVNLHHQGYDTEEISERMGLSKNAVYILLFRARAVLQKCMTAAEE